MILNYNNFSFLYDTQKLILIKIKKPKFFYKKIHIYPLKTNLNIISWKKDFFVQWKLEKWQQEELWEKQHFFLQKTWKSYLLYPTLIMKYLWLRSDEKWLFHLYFNNILILYLQNQKIKFQFYFDQFYYLRYYFFHKKIYWIAFQELIIDLKNLYHFFWQKKNILMSLKRILNLKWVIFFFF